MNKRALKEYAVYARNELRNQVILRAQAFGVTSTGFGQMEVGSDYIQINGEEHPLSYKKAYETLIKELRRKGFDQVIEEVAYTWFNRFIALRFMEVNDYLPSNTRVLSSETEGKVDPDILTMYRESGLSINAEEIQRDLHSGNREAAFRKLLISQCNQLTEFMPFLFEKINDYTDLLLPESLLHTDSVINRLVNEIDEEDFREVEIIGWLYQYYVSEKQRKLVGMNKGSISKEDLPAATQLFTPKWIVQYMVQNSLGKLWDDLHPQSKLVDQWEYYLKADRDQVLVPKNTELESIKVLDPACGSGHILVYAFDLLYEMYESKGYPNREIPYLILEKNLYGLEIDKRAAQLASFALIMKARSKYRRLFSKEIKHNIIEFLDAEEISAEALNYLTKDPTELKEIKNLKNRFENTKQFGSLTIPPDIQYRKYINKLEVINSKEVGIVEQSYISELKNNLLPVLTQAHYLSMNYEIVITNPPYHNKYNPVLKNFIEKYYNDYKPDLYSVFTYRCTQFTSKNGYASLMTPFTWMYITTHENLRNYIIENQSISSFVQLEYSAFKEATVPICTFVIQNQDRLPIGEYIRLSDFRGEEVQPVKVQEAVLDSQVSYRYSFNSKDFKDITGSPIAYWTSKKIRSIFKNSEKLENLAEPRQGLATSDNNRFLRLWYEPSIDNIGFGLESRKSAKSSNLKWFPYNKGGSFRKWFGNQNYVINWKDDGKEIREFEKSVIRNQDYYFREGITWSDVSSSNFGVRYSPKGFIFDVKGSTLFTKNEIKTEILLAFLGSKIAKLFLKVLNETISFQVGDLKRLPISLEMSEFEELNKLSKENINLSTDDWDSLETSWNFKKHLFIPNSNLTGFVSTEYEKWALNSKDRFLQLKENEEKINKYIIDIYGLNDEMTSEVQNNEVKMLLANRDRDTKSFLSYAIGCMMGRYSLDLDGLAYAGGEWDDRKYQQFAPDKNGIIPITDKEYFEDDIITYLEEFLKVTFGEENLQENLRWMSESLTLRNNETPIERLRRYFFDEFYNDHCKIYQKRPIYWMVESGKKKGFKALIYLHRYSPETLSNLRLNYLQELQVKYSHVEKQMKDALQNPSISASDKKRYNKELKLISDRQEELIQFDKILADYANQRIHLDLDDGVVANYEKLEPILAKIK